MIQLKKITFVVIGLLIMASCSTTKNSSSSSSNSSGEKGTSFETAIKVNSISEEYDWLRKHYPNYKMQMQSLSFNKKKPYDILSIVTAEGKKKEVYFDISSFYGKY